MYKYFDELDNPNDFNIYLINTEIKNEKVLSDISNNHLLLNEKIFRDINFLDVLIDSVNEKNSFFIPYDLLFDFLNFRDRGEPNENYKKMKEKIHFSSDELDELFYVYFIFCNFLKDIYPEYKEQIISIQNELSIIRKKINDARTILLPNQSITVDYTLPNAWFITPNGCLYNTGGENGHQEGNLIYPFREIPMYFNTGENIPYLDIFKKVNEIYKRGYITQEEFTTYANLRYKLPQFNLNFSQQYSTYLEKDENGNYLFYSYEWPFKARSYQKRIVDLITGYLTSKAYLYKSFERLNSSSKRLQHFIKIASLTNHYIPDILVRFSGFHKIESQVDKTITSASPNSIVMFKEYLDRGWNLNIIPNIVYDQYSDSISENNLNSYYVQKYLDEKLSEYNGKGKILVYKK